MLPDATHLAPLFLPFPCSTAPSPSPSPSPSPLVARIGDLVWLDLDCNGVQDAGEPGVGNVAVELRQGSSLVRRTTTNNQGFYSFANVVPGTYTVAFQRPSGFEFTTALVGTDDTINSKADTLSGLTAPITVLAGQDITDMDAGLCRGMHQPLALSMYNVCCG